MRSTAATRVAVILKPVREDGKAREEIGGVLAEGFQE